MLKKNDIAELVINAYENEICIENWTLDRGLVDRNVVEELNLPKYKLLKVFSKFKDRYACVKAIYCILSFSIYFIWLFQMVKIFCIVLLGKKKGTKKNGLIVTDNALSLKNFERISTEFISDKDLLYYKEVSSIASYISIKDIICLFNNVVISMKAVTSYRNQLTNQASITLKLHSSDIVQMVVFTYVLQKYQASGDEVYFDQHIQRWAYLISKIINDDLSNLVQHGYIDGGVMFKHKFGRINSVRLMSHSFESEFRKVYEVNKFILLKAGLTISPLVEAENKKIIFLASSPLSLEVENVFIELCLSKGYVILVKLHPKYSYDAQYSKYTNNGRFMYVEPSTFPDCDVMVSYNSFLGFEYESLGYKVFFLKDYNSQEQLQKLVFNILA